jgi:hypothetical protein
MTNALPQFAFISVLCMLAGTVVFVLWSSRRRRQRDWVELVADLQPVDWVGTSAVALDYLTPRPGQLEIETDEMWNFVGGYEGLKKMRANAEIMLALAAWTQQWNFEEGVIVGERMRHDAAALRSAIYRVKLGLIPIGLLRRFRFTLPIHVQEAASAYYLMRQRLLALYETSHAGRYSALAEAL